MKKLVAGSLLDSDPELHRLFVFTQHVASCQLIAHFVVLTHLLRIYSRRVFDYAESPGDSNDVMSTFNQQWSFLTWPYENVSRLKAFQQAAVDDIPAGVTPWAFAASLMNDPAQCLSYLEYVAASYQFKRSTDEPQSLFMLCMRDAIISSEMLLELLEAIASQLKSIVAKGVGLDDFSTIFIDIDVLIFDAGFYYFCCSIKVRLLVVSIWARALLNAFPKSTKNAQYFCLWTLSLIALMKI